MNSRTNAGAESGEDHGGVFVFAEGLPGSFELGSSVESGEHNRFSFSSFSTSFFTVCFRERWNGVVMDGRKEWGIK